MLPDDHGADDHGVHADLDAVAQLGHLVDALLAVGAEGDPVAQEAVVADPARVVDHDHALVGDADPPPELDGEGDLDAVQVPHQHVGAARQPVGDPVGEPAGTEGAPPDPVDHHGVQSGPAQLAVVAPEILAEELEEGEVVGRDLGGRHGRTLPLRNVRFG